MRAADLASSHIEEYVLCRQREGASNATINRELQVLKRAFVLATRRDPPKVARVPCIPLLPENNVRKGFLDDGQYLKLRNELPEYLRPLFVVAYHLGNRLGELRNVRWNQIDLKRNQIRLNPGETKNKEGGSPSLRRDASLVRDAEIHQGSEIPGLSICVSPQREPHC